MRLCIAFLIACLGGAGMGYWMGYANAVSVLGKYRRPFVHQERFDIPTAGPTPARFLPVLP